MVARVCSFLLLALLTLCACALKPGSGSEADSKQTIADILKAAGVDPVPSDCNEGGCHTFTHVMPAVVASRLNLAPFMTDPDGQGS